MHCPVLAARPRPLYIHPRPLPLWSLACIKQRSAALQVLLLENIGTSVRVGPTQLPTLHHLLTEAARILGMEAPDLYVRQVG